MSKFTNFRDRTNIETNVDKVNVTEFIEKSLSSTEIYDIRNDRIIRTVLTRDHKEGNDQTLLFTYIYEEPSENLVVGDYIEHRGKKYLIFMEFDHPLYQKYNKYYLLECNITINFDSFSQPAAYFSSVRKFNNSMQKNYGTLTVNAEDTKPVVITADNSLLKPNVRFLAAQESFRITSIDRISNNNIAYLSIVQAPYNASTNDLATGKAITPPAPTTVTPLNSFKKGSQVAISTNYAYAKFEPTVKVITRTMTTVTFEVPYDINSLSISTKDAAQNIVTNSYEVV